jgi:hypothetical protein
MHDETRVMNDEDRHRFTARQKQLWIQSPSCWQRSLDRPKSASTPSTLAWWKPRVFTQAASLEAISKSCLRHKARSEESDSETTLLPPSSFSLHQMRAGSLAKHWSSRAAIAD